MPASSRTRGLQGSFIVPMTAYISDRWRVNAECGYWIVSLVSIAGC